MYIICSDLEGIYTPEIWINVSKQTGIEGLMLTTRDINDYNVLMKGRLALLKQHNLKLSDIQNVIRQIEPLPGARDFLDWLRSEFQLIIVSDTFSEFADPLMEKLGRPTLLCHNLITDSEGTIVDYNLRQPDAKRKVVESLQSLNYKVIAIGDSYNDISMLRKADKAILFRPPKNVSDENPDLPVVTNYEDLKKSIYIIAEN
ncbi:MAG TPA: bifunctional phosphoserine phosphatase/homoserine phosphotransferase ThrH [Bacteroidales bacterium]|nr:bifunctional phosphoserine phosphatase/homoserine phosphotransferase ThrH [Bacteroidales bacterium]